MHRGPETPSHVSSLTRRDLELFLGWLTDRDDFALSDWQWRVLVGLGLVQEQSDLRVRFREALRQQPHVVFVPAGVDWLPGEDSRIEPTLLHTRLGERLAAADCSPGDTAPGSDGELYRVVRYVPAPPEDPYNIWVRN